MCIENNDSPKAYYPGKNYDQSVWVWEKSERLLKCLCKLIDANQPKNEDLKGYLKDALKYAFLLYTFWIGKRELATEDNLELILNYGSEGFNRFNYINDLSYEIDELSKIEHDKKTEQEISELIVYEQNNRTLIHQNIHQLYYKSDLINELEDDIEKVSMGEETWKWFVDKYKGIKIAGD